MHVLYIIVIAEHCAVSNSICWHYDSKQYFQLKSGPMNCFEETLDRIKELSDAVSNIGGTVCSPDPIVSTSLLSYVYSKYLRHWWIHLLQVSPTQILFQAALKGDTDCMEAVLLKIDSFSFGDAAKTSTCSHEVMTQSYS